MLQSEEKDIVKVFAEKQAKTAKCLAEAAIIEGSRLVECQQGLSRKLYA